ncbi:MAG: ComEC family competence protein, partial [Parabacteroides sp.]|nr:ComEC family competence protein [Parabacteroides sp.]
MIKELVKRPFSRLLFLLSTGILLQYYWPAAFWWSYVLPVPALLAMSIYTYGIKKNSFGWRWLWGAGFACLFLFLSVQWMHRYWLDLQWQPPAGEIVARVTVTGPVEIKGRSAVCSARLQSYEYRDSLLFTRRKIRIYFTNDTAALRLQPGDCLWVQGRFRTLSGSVQAKGYEAYWRNKGVSAISRVAAGNWWLVSSSHALPYGLLRLRNRLLSHFHRLELTSDERAVIAALAFGYTGGLEGEVRNRFSITGVAHLLAVSGFHVGVIAGFLVFLFGFLPRWLLFAGVKYVILVLAVWAFVLFTGAAAPAVRAASVFSLYCAGRLVRRSSDAYNTLAAAAFLMLVWNPYNLFDIGFQLSFTAVFFILYLQPRLSSLLPVRNPVIRYGWNGLTVTLGAQIGTAPLCLYAFGSFPALFIFTNFPMALLAMLLISATFIWVVAEQCFSSGVYLQRVVELCGHAFFRLADRFARVPGASFSVPFGFWEMVVCYAILFFFLIYRRNRRPKMFLASLGLIVVLLLLLYVRR